MFNLDFRNSLVRNCILVVLSSFVGAYIGGYVLLSLNPVASITSKRTKERGSTAEHSSATELSNGNTQSDVHNVSGEFEDSMAKFELNLKTKDLKGAQAMLSRAVEYNGSDPRLLDMGSRLIERCLAELTDENKQIVYEVEDQLDEILLFQSVENLKGAYIKLREIRQRLTTEGLLKVVHSNSKESTDEFDAALVDFDSKLSANDLAGAQIMLSRAIVVNASDQRLLDMGSRLITLCLAEPTDESRQIASDVVSRLESLIPFQQVAHIPAAMQKLDEAVGVLLTSESADELNTELSGSSDDSEAETMGSTTQQHELEYAAEIAVIRPELALLILNGIRESMVATALQERPGANAVDYWTSCDSIEKDIQRIELTAMESLYSEVHEKVENVFKTPASADDSIESIDGLLMEVFPYMRAGVGAAIEDEARIRERISEVGWEYNLFAVGVIVAAESGKQSPSELLKNLVKIDISRLNPVYQERYHEAWKKQYDECSVTEQNEALKLQLMRGSGL